VSRLMPANASRAADSSGPVDSTHIDLDRGPVDVDHAEVLGVIKQSIAGDGWVLCLGHIQPDADALGSALALAFAIRSAGGDACVSFDPGPLAFGMPPSLDFLPGGQLLISPSDLRRRPAPDAVITFDTGTVERLGALEPYAVPREDGPPVIMIDHHARGNAFGSMRMVDATAAATAELIADLIDQLGVPFDRPIATCLYAGLASDTGSFRYAATSPGSHRLAARLLEAGAEHDTISMLLWDTRPASYLQVLSGALARVQYAGEVVWTFVTCADVIGAGATPEETEGIVDVIRGSREHEVAVVLKQDPSVGPGWWKASVRSRGRLDVGAACTELGGGGHRLAAGFSAEGTPQEIISRLRAALSTVA
jgi:bifunctional oligoribonuclease and PAP phosphatase NrnA